MLKNSQKIILGLLTLTLLLIALMMAFNSQEESLKTDDNLTSNERNFKTGDFSAAPRSLSGPDGVSKKELDNHRVLMEKKMDEDLEKYFSLKTQEEKNKYLDELIAEHKKRMDERGKAGNDDKNPPGPGPGAPPPDQAGGRGRPSPKDMKKHLESTSPETRAKRIQMMTEMRARENSAR